MIPKKEEKHRGYHENMLKDIHRNMNPNQLCLGKKLRTQQDAIPGTVQETWRCDTWEYGMLSDVGYKYWVVLYGARSQTR